VRFSPTTAGEFASSLVIESNDVSLPAVAVSLAGGSGPDLTGQWTVPVTQTCSKTKCKIAGSLIVENTGNLNAASSAVKFYLSDDGVHYSEAGFLKQTSTGALKLGAKKTKKLSASLAKGTNAAGKYVIAVIDPDQRVVEASRGNNRIVSGPIQ
jgi:hypothetical protein